MGETVLKISLSELTRARILCSCGAVVELPLNSLHEFTRCPFCSIGQLTTPARLPLALKQFMEAALYLTGQAYPGECPVTIEFVIPLKGGQ